MTAVNKKSNFLILVIISVFVMAFTGLLLLAKFQKVNHFVVIIIQYILMILLLILLLAISFFMIKYKELYLKKTSRNDSSKIILSSGLPIMVYRCKYDRHWTMKYVSGACFELTGYDAEGLLYNREVSYNDIIDHEYRDEVYNKWKIAVEEKDIFKEEYPILTADGERKWLYEQGQGIYDKSGKIIELEGLLIDITKLKKREEEIQYLLYHDLLTGVYNRRYFEDAKKRLDNIKNYPLSIIVGDINGLKLINESFGHKEGDKILVSIADVLKSCCRPRDVLARTGGDEFSILMPNTPYEEANQILTRISDLCNEFSNLNTEYYLSFSAGLATKADDIMSMNRLIKMAEDSMYRNKLLQNKSLHSSMINSMKTSLYEKSQETEEHAMRLIEISRAFGRKLNLVEEQLIELELLSTLHDIGKISITDNILNKPGKLTVDEWVKMKQHPEAGYRIAMATPELKQIADYILNHHERWDGSGYPYGKKGDEIPLLSRIISIADAYDAMTTDRPYRKAMSKSEALDEIKRNAGSQFDPRLAELFINEIAIYL